MLKYERKTRSDIVAELIKRDGERCQYCSVYLLKEEMTVDHVIPISRGGGHEIYNLVLSCSKCNSENKSNLLPLELFFKERFCKRKIVIPNDHTHVILKSYIRYRIKIEAVPIEEWKNNWLKYFYHIKVSSCCEKDLEKAIRKTKGKQSGRLVEIESLS